MSEERLVPLSPHESGSPSRGRGAFRGSGTARREYVLRVRNVGSMLDLGVELFRDNFLRYFGLAALLWIPERIAQVFFGAHQFSSAGLEDPTSPLFIGFMAATVLKGATGLLATAAVSILVFADLEGRPVSVLGALGLVVRRLPALVVAAIVTVVLYTIGLMCFCVPGILILWKLQLTTQTIVLEQASLVQCFQRSWDLTHTSILRWAGLAIVSFVLTGPMGSAVDLPFSEMRPEIEEFLGLSGAAFDAVFMPLTTLFVAVTFAFAGVVWTMYYVDQSVRREGLDLTLGLKALSEDDVKELPELSG